MKPKSKSTKNKRLTDAEWHNELVKRLVYRVRSRYQKSPKFIRHLITSFVDQGDNVESIKHTDIDPNVQQLTCAISNYLFDDKVPALKSRFSTALISETALDALVAFKEEIWENDATLRELYEKRDELKPREIKKSFGATYTLGDVFNLKNQRK